jgi:ABC-type lipoprotein release transport system permease subunit
MIIILLLIAIVVSANIVSAIMNKYKDKHNTQIQINKGDNAEQIQIMDKK